MGVGRPLGLFDTPLLDQQEVVIPQGGTVLTFSDGLSDALEKTIGEDPWQRVCCAVSAIPSAAAQEICDRLWDEARAAATDPGAQMDDFVLVVVKRAAIHPSSIARHP
jgi:serine phosphatase RsbU (regulator of sigma subunit)